MKARGFKMVLFALLFVAGFSAVVMLLWNALFPAIFGLTAITFWQALGLFILSKILFGGFGGFKMGIRGMNHHDNPIHKKWMEMTPDQRKEFINKRKRFGFGGPLGSHDFVNDDRFNSQPENRNE